MRYFARDPFRLQTTKPMDPRPNFCGSLRRDAARGVPVDVAKRLHISAVHPQHQELAERPNKPRVLESNCRVDDMSYLFLIIVNSSQ